MKIFTVDGEDYRLPTSLNSFQREMYVHLINWKWGHITREAGRDRGNIYDALFPDGYTDQMPVLYPGLKAELDDHSFRVHTFFNHMASSQAANINLWLPILHHPEGHQILKALKPDFDRLAVDQFLGGYQIEFRDPYDNLQERGGMRTDSDLAIAYLNCSGKLCLWLIEHKLTEAEFTQCGAARSKGRKPHHDCKRSFSEIIRNKSICYYHDVTKYNYWKITEAHQDFFAHQDRHPRCPFKGGMNQLWRNQLLAFGMEQDERQPYRQVYFSVVKHPGNKHLDKTITEYRELIGNNPKFSVFTSADVIKAAENIGDPILGKWTEWYRELYNL